MLTQKLIKKVQKYCHKLDCFTYIHITSWLKIEFHDIWSESTVNKIKIKKSKNPDKIFWGYLLRIKQENTGKDVSFIKIFAIKGTYMSVIRLYSSASLSTVLVNDSFINPTNTSLHNILQPLHLGLIKSLINAARFMYCEFILCNMLFFVQTFSKYFWNKENLGF